MSKNLMLDHMALLRDFHHYTIQYSGDYVIMRIELMHINPLTISLASYQYSLLEKCSQDLRDLVSVKISSVSSPKKSKWSLEVA